MARVTIYTTSVCPFCAQAKRLLGELAIAYDEIDVGRDEARDPVKPRVSPRGVYAPDALERTAARLELGAVRPEEPVA